MVIEKTPWYFAALMVFSAFFACQNKGYQAAVDSDTIVAADTDTILMDAQDSLVMLEEEKAFEALPESADELFDDFIYAYASNLQMQLKRTKFPLLVHTEAGTQSVSRNQWRKDPLFAHHDVYCTILDHRQDDYWCKDTTIHNVAIEWIDLNSMQSRDFHFSRPSKHWQLSEVNVVDVNTKATTDFLHFYKRFVTDSLFQRSHIDDPLRFVTASSDSDDPMDGTLDIEQWFVFRPELPTSKMITINYGQPQACPDHKTLFIRGVSNGMVEALSFRHSESGWILTTYEN